MPSPLHPLSQPNPAGYRDVAVTAARPHLTTVRVIDVREPDEFVGPLGHIDSATLTPLATVPAAAATWDKNAPTLVVCRSGARSGRAATALVQAGFREVYNLAGGMMAWNDAGFPVSRN